MPPRTLLPFALLLSTVARAPNARAQDSQNRAIAEALFRDAQAALRAGDVHAACEKFGASQQADPALGTLLNLGVCHEKEGKTATAWTELLEVVSEAIKAGDSVRERYAKARAAALEGKLCRVSLEVAAPGPGLIVTLDDHPLAREAWGTPLPLDPGVHRLAAAAPGAADYRGQFELGSAPGRVETVHVPALTPLPAGGAAEPRSAAAGPPSANAVAAPAPAVPLATADRGSASSRRALVPVVVAAAAGAVGLGVGIVFGAESIAEAHTRDQLCPPGRACADGPTYGRALDAYHRAVTDQVVGIVGDVAGALGLGVAAWLLWGPSGLAPAVAVLPTMESGGGRLTATGHF